MTVGKLEEANAIQAELKRVGAGAEVSDEPAEGAAVVAARRRFDKAVERAEAVRSRAVEAAKKQYIRDLQVSIAAALKAGNLEEANRLKAIRDGLQPAQDGQGKAAGPKPANGARGNLAGAKAGRPQVRNLVALQKWEDGIVRGRWTRKGDALLADNGGTQCVMRFPYEPPAEYNYCVEFTVRFLIGPQRLPSLHLLFPHGKLPGDSWLKIRKDNYATYTGFNMTGGTSTEGPFFEEEQRYRVEVQVRKDKVSTYVDGKLVSDAKPDPSNTDMVPFWVYGGHTTLGLATEFAVLEFHSITVEEIGEAGTVIKQLPIGEVPSIEGELPSEKPNKVVNLAKLADPRGGAVEGTWGIEDGNIVSNNPQGRAVLRLPYHPADEYDFRVTLAMKTGSEVGLLVNRGQRAVNFTIGSLSNTRAGFSVVANQYLDPQNPTTLFAPRMTEVKRKYTIVVYVRKTFIAASVDGKLVAKYATDFSDLKPIPPCPRNFLGLHTIDTTAVFNTIEVAEITGEGKVEGKPVEKSESEGKTPGPQLRPLP